MRILIIEDDEFIRVALVEILEDDGIDCVATSNGQEALARSKKEKFDLLLVDQRIPGFSGLEVAKAVRSDPSSPCHSAPIVMMTASLITDQEAVLRECGINSWLRKPFEFSELYAVMRRVLPGWREEPPIEERPIDVLSEFGKVSANETLLTRLVETFCTQLPEALRALKQAADIAEIRFQAHRLKSSSRMLGAMRLGALLERLETAIYASEDEARAEISGLIGKVEKEAHRAVRRLRERLSTSFKKVRC